MYVNILLWGIKHEHPVISQSALKILAQFLFQVTQRKSPQEYNPFFAVYYYQILQDILQIMTDTMHTSGLKLQTRVLLELIRGVAGVGMGAVSGSANSGNGNSAGTATHPAGSPPGGGNAGAQPAGPAPVITVIDKNEVMRKIAVIFQASFETLQATAQIEAFVLGLFNKCGDPEEFAVHVKDFLIQIKAFGGPDALWELEKKDALERAKTLDEANRNKVPGMVPQHAGQVRVPGASVALDAEDDML